ncbi:AAA family ATPase [Proteobacteria bacterium 005FR1]|nr:AAA family ATPase [Proteobacteria bacterium 005FR1]
MSLPLDHDARRDALDPTRSFAVSAPAGSGKTGLLTQRVLTLLARCDYPEEVLGITFTRKAAQEMAHRIITALQQAAAGVEGNSDHDRLTFELARQVLARDEEMNWRLLLSPSRLRIQTIDAFCQSLTRKLPIAAGASAYLETRENASGLYRAAVQELFRELRTDGPLADALTVLLRHMDNNLDKVESLLMQLLDQRTQWLAPLYQSGGNRHYFEATVQAIVDDALSAVTEKLAHCLDDVQELLRFSTANRLSDGHELPFSEEHIDFAELALDSQLALSVWQAVVDICLTQAGDWRKSIDKRGGFPAPSSSKNAEEKALFTEMKTRHSALLGAFGDQPELLSLFNDLRALPNLGVDKNQWELLESLSLLLPSLAAFFHLHCQKVGEADFAEMAIAASRALGEEDKPSDLALKLDYQIKHILVDEFQDTSLPQLQLLQKLTAGWQPEDGRTLFIVGDAMQSCYGFRDANVGIFIQARDQGIGTVPLTPLNLTVNFRSDSKLVSWVNRCFRGIFPPRNDINRGAVRYSLAQPCANHDAGKIEVRGFVDVGQQAQTRYLVQLVEEALADTGENETVAILARSRPHLQDILRELRAAEIPWQAKDIDALRNRMAVVDLLSLTRALLNVSDRIAWLSLLRAPWCGLDLHDLHTLANQSIAENPPLASNYPLVWGQILHCESLDLSTEGLALIQRLRTVLKPALAEKGRKSLRQWIEGVWLALGGPAAVANPAELHSPARFFDLLDGHASGGDIEDWEDFENALASLYDKSESSSRLQVMTIHKSKGLEFDTVIIPRLDKGTRGDDSPLLLWQEYTDRQGETHLLISPLGAVGEKADGLYSYLKRERGIRQEHEAARLLYVGCTRAISQLYLMMDLQRDEKSGELKAPGKGTLAGHLWPYVKNEIVLMEDSGESETAAPGTQLSLSHLLRLPPEWKAPEWPSDHTLARYRGQQPAEDDDNRPDPSFLLNRHQRYLGTVLHSALQQLTEEGSVAWNESRIIRQQPLWNRQLRQLGMSAHDAAEGASQIAGAVQSALQDPIGRWLLDNRHEDSHCELSLLTAAVGYREAVIDRTFIDQGTRWIVDYKAGAPAPEQSQSEFLQAAEQEYAAQLQRYAELMGKLDRAQGRSLPVKTALYFPLPRLFHEIAL